MPTSIWKYYLLQYKKKVFILRFILFVYLITLKVSIFQYITTSYNANFQITLDKLANIGSTFLFNF